MSERSHGVSPWRTAFEMVMSRHRSEPSESVSVKTVTTGALAGSTAVDVIGYRQDGETLLECADRVNVVYEQAYRTHNTDPVVPF